MTVEHTLLQDVLLAIAVALALVYLLGKIRIPTLVGFLFAGILIGPGGLGLIQTQSAIEKLAEIGVVLLLFTIGLNFPLKELKKLKLPVWIAGFAQLVGTTVITILIIQLCGGSLKLGFLIGLLITMSSTAIVFKLLDDHGESDSAHGRMMISILIFQDLAIIPLLLLLPMLSGDGGSVSSVPYGITLLKSFGIIALILLAGHYVLPWVLKQMAYTRSQEVFSLATILIVLGTALLASRFGISLALGAFLAGMVIAESDYSHQMMSEIAPLRNALSSMFFISVGLLVNPRQWFMEPVQTLGVAAWVMLIKIAVIYLVVMAAGFGKRVAILVSFGLAQIGEFSFILAQTGFHLGLMSKDWYDQFLSTSVLTMSLTPLLSHAGQRLTEKLKLQKAAPTSPQSFTDHVIVVGYGISGHSVARVLKQMSVANVIIELNPATVKKMQLEGETVFYGDATQPHVLMQAGVGVAKILVIAIADPLASRIMVATARRLNTDIFIIVRTRYISEVSELYRLGANEVIPEELETALELVSRIMQAYGKESLAIEKELDKIRTERYQALHQIKSQPKGGKK